MLHEDVYGLMLAEVHQASRAKLAMELKRILASP